jgi:hypothetical protein
VQSVGEFQVGDQVLGYEALLASVVQDQSIQLNLNLTIMCKHGYIRDVKFISGYQDQRRVHFGRIFERDYFRMVKGIWLRDLCK